MRLYIITALFLFAIQLSFAQKKLNTSLDEMVNAERLFAKMSKDETMKKAFLTFLSDSTIMFIKGNPSLGKPFYSSINESDQYLFWWPNYVGISAAGNFGYSIGPYHWSPTKKDSIVGYGQYFTVWEKSQVDSWKMTFDTGISHPKPISQTMEIYESLILKSESSSINKDLDNFEIVNSNYDKLLSENHLSFDSSFFAKNLLILRDGKVLFHYVDNSIDELKGKSLHFKTYGYKVSNANDMAYSYGLASKNSRDEWYYFARIWVKEENVWKLKVDLVSLHKNTQ